MRAWKLTTGMGAVVLTACLACGPGFAQNNKHGGGGGGGGAAPHVGGGGGGAPHIGGGGGGGAPHFGGGGGGAPHFGGGGGAPHFNAAPHITAAPHISAPHIVAAPHVNAPRFAPHVGAARNFAPRVTAGGRRGAGIAHVAPPTRMDRSLRGPTGTHVRTATPAKNPAVTGATRGARGTAALRGATPNTAAVRGATPNAGAIAGNAVDRRAARNAARLAGLHASVNHVSGTGSARNFAERRNFARVGALRPFFNDPWHRRHNHFHLGWIGPLFWPYAYGDVFYYALWPYEYEYYDPFWAYGYGDVYEAIFSPYDYGSYVSGYGGYGSHARGRRGSTRLAALTQSVGQTCTDEAAEVTGWPIDQIQAVVQPDQQQRTLLDNLGNAIVKASGVIKSHCPTQVSFTAPDRLADMQVRLEGLVQAIAIVQPPLAKFYDSLNDEQRARFNAMGEPSGQRQPPRGRQAAQSPRNQCGENALAWPADQIERTVRPNGNQRARLDALDAAAAQAAETIKAACPSELPATPPDRLAAESQRLHAILEAVQTVRPKLADFYASLTNEQKARFNSIGRQLFAAR